MAATCGERSRRAVDDGEGGAFGFRHLVLIALLLGSALAPAAVRAGRMESSGAAAGQAAGAPGATAIEEDEHGENPESSERDQHHQRDQHRQKGEIEEDVDGDGHAHSSRLSDEAQPLRLEGFPKRPKPILELGSHFLGTGTLDKGVKLPTGAVWQPAFLAFGALRTAVQTFDRGDERTTEAVARLDLFGNLQLSGTERLVLGFRNFDRDGQFTSYVFESGPSGPGEGFHNETNADISSLFFEGDFGEIFPNLSRQDFGTTDWGFSVGRQPLSFQEGLLINDSIDGIGVTRNTLQPSGISNFRATVFLGWNNLHRSDRNEGRANLEDDSATLLALLTSTDRRRTTLDADAAWLFSDDGDLANLGVSGVQRFGHLNSSLRVVASFAPDGESTLSTNGVLFFSELSWTPRRTHNLAYVTNFWALDDFSSVARDPSAGGPLGRAGINFAAVGLGSFGAPLSSQAREVVGGAAGYQMFFHNTRRQLIVELGVRVGTAGDVEDQAAVTLRYQVALGRRFVVVTDGFVGVRDRVGRDRTSLSGGRLELVTKF